MDLVGIKINRENSHVIYVIHAIMYLLHTKSLHYFLKMSKLLLFEEFQSDSKSLFSSLLVNRLWCETVIPIYDINYQKKSALYHITIFYLLKNS